MNFKLKIIVVLFTILMIVLIGVKLKDEFDIDKKNEQKKQEIFLNISNDLYAEVTKYIVYGKNFNISGNIKIPQISKISISKVNLIIKSLSGDQKQVKAKYTYSDGILEFSTIAEINKGLNLEELNIDNYYFFIEVIFSNNEKNMYSLKNSTDYENITYYTVTKNNSNNVINLEFDEYNNISYFGAKISKIDSLPEDIYDIVIDPRSWRM